MYGKSVVIYLIFIYALGIININGGVNRVLGKYVLVWSDEFDAPELNTSRWDIEVDCWGGGNFEKQCYTSNPQNIYIEDGKLVLHAVPGTYMGSTEGCTNNNEYSCTWTQPTTSGRVRSLNDPSGSFLYGRMEASLKLPKGDFLWPAFWMLPTNAVYGTWASSGEIDIMEFRGQKRSTLVNTIHFGAQWPNNKYISSDEYDIGFDCTEDFHQYAMEWTPEQIAWFVDDVQTFSVDLNQQFGELYDHNRAPFDRRFHVILNLAVGGGFFDPNTYGTFDAGRDVASWESPRFLIDYVRVYRDDSLPPTYCFNCYASNQPGQPEQPGQQPLPGQPEQPGQQPLPGQPEQPGQQPLPGQPGQPGQQPLPGQPEQPGQQPLPGQPEQTGQQQLPRQPRQPRQTGQQQPPLVRMSVLPEHSSHSGQEQHISNEFTNFLNSRELLPLVSYCPEGHHDTMVATFSVAGMNSLGNYFLELPLDTLQDMTVELYGMASNDLTVNYRKSHMSHFRHSRQHSESMPQPDIQPMEPQYKPYEPELDPEYEPELDPELNPEYEPELESDEDRHEYEPYEPEDGYEPYEPEDEDEPELEHEEPEDEPGQESLESSLGQEQYRIDIPRLSKSETNMDTRNLVDVTRLMSSAIEQGADMVAFMIRSNGVPSTSSSLYNMCLSGNNNNYIKLLQV